MGMRGSSCRVAFFLLIARVSVAEPTAEHAEAAEVGFVHTDVVGEGVVDTPPASFAETSAGVVQIGFEDGAGAIGDDDPFGDVVLVGNERGYYCTGVVVSDSRVLTARHCAGATRVGFGNAVRSSVAVRVTDVVRHPHLDVALLVLDKQVKSQTHARRTLRDGSPPIGALRLLGFGVRDHLRLTGFGTKRHVEVDVDGWGCTAARSRVLGCVIADELVVRGGQGNDTCLGDSGGPVFEWVDDQWRLIAITSRGMRPRKVICGEGGIYTRVDRISAWLEKETRQ